jgi:hypothetical protein
MPSVKRTRAFAQCRASRKSKVLGGILFRKVATPASECVLIDREMRGRLIPRWNSRNEVTNEH